MAKTNQEEEYFEEDNVLLPDNLPNRSFMNFSTEKPRTLEYEETLEKKMKKKKE